MLAVVLRSHQVWRDAVMETALLIGDDEGNGDSYLYRVWMHNGQEEKSRMVYNQR